MNKFNTIQAGYRVTIISWENDGDAYDTNIIEGLSKERVEFIIELCKLFYSGSNNGGRTFGNMYEPNAYKLNKACVAIQAVMSNHCAVLTDEEQHLLSLDIDGDDFSDSYLFTEMMADYLGRSEEDFAFRVFATMKIERIPHEIQLEDVTGKFDVCVTTYHNEMTHEQIKQLVNWLYAQAYEGELGTDGEYLRLEELKDYLPAAISDGEAAVAASLEYSKLV